MTTRSPWFVVLILSMVLAVSGYIAWPYFFEKRMTAVTDISLESLSNPMLAITRLLEQRGYTVRKQDSLTLALGQALPKGIMFLSDSGGRLTQEQLDELLAWVGEGNVLITKPKYSAYVIKNAQSTFTEEYDDESSDDDSDYQLRENDKGYISADPLSEYLGVFLEYAHPKNGDGERQKENDQTSELKEQEQEQEQAEKNDKVSEKTVTKKRPFVEMVLPSAAYPLQLAHSETVLNADAEYEAPRYADSHGGNMRIYAEGRGYIALITQNNYENEVLLHLDHGELFWHLLQLNPNHKHLLIVDHLEMPTWYQALWSNFYYPLIAVLIALLLILWHATRRFGPLLPEPSSERRAQMEHVLASARWLWRLPQGRQHLLNAAQADTLALILRRAPELTRLSEEDKWQRIARDCALSPEHIKHAFSEQVGTQPNDFTQQIHTLQQLRKHYER